MNAKDSIDLSGKLLVAMPGMGDPRFEKAVIFMCAHTPEGAMGLIINKPAPEVKVADLLDQLKIPRISSDQEIRAHFGGPVELGRGFVLHDGDYDVGDSTMHVSDEFGMTATLSILENIAKGDGPAASILMLGYSGWGPGQLEDEIGLNGWLTCEATPELVFGTLSDQKWAASLASMGVDPQILSPTAGRA